MKRRTHGEGTFFERERNGVKWFVARVSDGVDGSGRRRRRDVWARTRAELRDKVAAIRDEQRKHGKLTKRTSIGDYLRAWLRDVAPETTRKSTLIRYEREIELHILPHIKNVPIGDFDAADVRAMLASWARADIGPATVKNARQCLGTALNAAVRAELLARNPVSLVSPPKYRPRDVVPYSAPEIAKLIAATAGSDIEHLIVLAIYSQMRVGELIALSIDDVDLTTGVLSVRRGASVVKGAKREIMDPKTESSKRDIQLGPTAIAAVRAQIESVLERGLRARGLLFPRDDGKLMSPEKILRQLYEVMDAAGLRRISTHNLRDSGATLLAQHVPLATLRDRLGHESLTTTNAYIHRNLSAQAAAADALEGLIGGATGGASIIETPQAARRVRRKVL